MIHPHAHLLVFAIVLMVTGCSSVETTKCPTPAELATRQIRNRTFIEILDGKLYADKMDFSCVDAVKSSGVAKGRVFFERDVTLGADAAPVLRAYAEDARFDVFANSIELRGMACIEKLHALIDSKDPTTVITIKGRTLDVSGPATTFLR